MLVSCVMINITYLEIIHVWRSYMCGDHTCVEIIHVWRSYRCGDHTDVEIIHVWRSYRCGDHTGNDRLAVQMCIIISDYVRRTLV